MRHQPPAATCCKMTNHLFTLPFGKTACIGAWGTAGAPSDFPACHFNPPSGRSFTPGLQGITSTDIRLSKAPQYAHPSRACTTPQQHNTHCTLTQQQLKFTTRARKAQHGFTAKLLGALPFLRRLKRIKKPSQDGRQTPRSSHSPSLALHPNSPCAAYCLQDKSLPQLRKQAWTPSRYQKHQSSGRCSLIGTPPLLQCCSRTPSC